MELFSLSSSPRIATKLSSSSSSSRKILIDKHSFISTLTINKIHTNAGTLKFSHFKAQASGSLQGRRKSNPGTVKASTEQLQSKDSDVVFVAGATGKVGLRTVRELLKLGFEVRAAVRSPQKADTLVKSVQQMKLDDGAEAVEKLKLVECDLEKGGIEQAIGNASVVICCIGASEKEISDITGPYRIDYKATENLVDAAKSAGVNHFILVTSLGTNKIGFPAAILNLFWGVLIWKRKAEEALIASGLPYTIVRPGGMERPTDAYKETHNLVLAKEDTRFGGQVSNLQVAELVAFMAKNRSLSYCKVVEVIAETTAPLTPMGDLLATIPSDRVDNSPAKELQDIPLPKLTPSPNSVPEATSTVITEPPPETTVQKMRPLSPYIAYDDLKPPTSPTPISPGGQVNVVKADSLTTSVDQVRVSEPITEVTTPKSEQVELQNTRPLSPYSMYEDLKPPTTPTPPQATSKDINLTAAPLVEAIPPSTGGSPIIEKEASLVIEEVSAVLPQKTSYLSPYYVYEDLKPPTIPTPPQATSKDINVTAAPLVEAIPPSTGGSPDIEKEPSVVIEEEVSVVLPQKTSYLSPYHVYEDLKPPTTPTPPQATSKDINLTAAPLVDSIPPFIGGSPVIEKEPSLAIEEQVSEVLPQKTSYLSPYYAYEDFKPPASPYFNARKSPSTIGSEPQILTVPGVSQAQKSTLEILEEDKHEICEPKPRPLSPFTMYEDLKPPTSPIQS